MCSMHAKDLHTNTIKENNILFQELHFPEFTGAKYPNKVDQKRLDRRSEGAAGYVSLHSSFNDFICKLN